MGRKFRVTKDALCTEVDAFELTLCRWVEDVEEGSGLGEFGFLWGDGALVDED